MSAVTSPPDATRLLNGTGLTEGKGLINGSELTSIHLPTTWILTHGGGLEKKKKGGLLQGLRRLLGMGKASPPDFDEVYANTLDGPPDVDYKRP